MAFSGAPNPGPKKNLKKFIDMQRTLTQSCTLTHILPMKTMKKTSLHLPTDNSREMNQPLTPPKNVMKKFPTICLLSLLALGSSQAATVLFTDSFNRADNTDINLNSAVDQSGTIGAQLYTEHTTVGATDPQISGGRLLLGPGTQSRAALDYNLFGSAAAITGDGAFEVAYTVNPGVSWTSGAHGSYGFRTYISQASVAKSTILTTNTNQSLALEVRGNGQVLLYSQNATPLFNVTLAASGWNTRADNSVRILVDTDGFSTTSNNTASIFINDTLVGSAQAFNWKTNNDVYLALEAYSQSSSFENLSITAIPEPGTWALLAFSLAALVIFRRRRSTC
jgi:hypothetical protein